MLFGSFISTIFQITVPGSSSSSGGYGHGGTIDRQTDNELGLSFILVPLVILLIAVPLLALMNVQVTGKRSFGEGRGSELDDKFGSFEELQREVDNLLAKYISALDSDDCVDRIVCELGVKASAIPSKEMFFR